MPAVILPFGSGQSAKTAAETRDTSVLSGPCFNISNVTDTTQAFEVMEAEVSGILEWCLLISYSDINDYRACFTSQEQADMIPYDQETQRIL